MKLKGVSLAFLIAMPLMSFGMEFGICADVPDFSKALSVVKVTSPGKDIFVFGCGEKAAVVYTLKNASARPFYGAAEFSFETHKGQILHKANATVEIAPGGTAQVAFDAVTDELPYGVYYTRIALSAAQTKTPVLVREGSLLVGPTNLLRHAKDGEFLFGLDPCSGFHADHSELLKWARWMGVDILRYGVNRRCQKEQERDILRLREEGMRVLAITDGSRKDDYSAFLVEQSEVDAFVADFAARVRPPFWELGNEPDLPYFFRPGMVRYMEGYGRMYSAIKSADPEAKVMNGGLCRPIGKFDRTEKFFELVDPAKIDYVAYHAHGIGYAAEERQFRHMKAHAAAVGKPGLRFCDTETGISVLGRDPELLQASTCVQKFVFALENNLPFLIWFRLYFKGREEGYGNLETYKEPRPVVLAYRTLVERLRGFVFDRRIDVGNDAVKVFLFRAGDSSKKRVAVCWSDSPGSLSLEGSFGFAVRCDIFGNAKELAGDSRIDIRLSPLPVYVEWNGGDVPAKAQFEYIEPPESLGVLVLGEASIDNYFIKEPDGSRYWQGDGDLSARAAARQTESGFQLAIAVRDSRHVAPVAALGPGGDFAEIADAKGRVFKAGCAADGSVLASGCLVKVRRDESRGETRYTFELPSETSFPLAIAVHDDDWGEPKQKAQGALKGFMSNQTKEKTQ